MANPSLLQAFWFSILTYHLSIGLARLSVILQCMRIFPQAAFGFARWLVRSLLVLDILNMFWSFFSSLFICFPVEKSWYPDRSGRCFKRIVIWMINSTTAMVLDFAVAGMALPWIKHLRLPMRQKVLLGGVFVLAGFPCVLAIIRLQSLIQVATSASSPYQDSILGIFSASEVYVAIICACLPNLRTLYSQTRSRCTNSWICRYMPTSSCSGSKIPAVLKWAGRHVPGRNSRSSSTPRYGAAQAPLQLAALPRHDSDEMDPAARAAEDHIKRPDQAAVRERPQHITHVAFPEPPRIGLLSSLQETDQAALSQMGQDPNQIHRLGLLHSTGPASRQSSV